MSRPTLILNSLNYGENSMNSRKRAASARCTVDQLPKGVCGKEARRRERESTLTMDLDSKRFVRIDKHGDRGRQLFSEQATNRLIYPLS